MFSGAYLDLCESILSVVRDRPSASYDESPAPPRRMDEKIVRSIWMEQPWAPYPVRDVRGRAVEVLAPGWLNGGAGPDFKDALFRYDNGDVEKGDVELHVRSSDWARHGHGRDPAYNRVRLHVVMFCDVTRTPAIRQDGKPLIELELAPVCPDALGRMRSEGTPRPDREIISALTGRCGAAMEKLGPQRAGELLGAAGEGRLILKSRRYREAISKGTGEEELYQGIFESMGYSSFKTQFQRLAASAPLRTLRCVMGEITHRRRPMALQAVLLGMAGLIPNPEIDGTGPDRETADYMERCWSVWGELSKRYDLKAALSADAWKLRGTRPANYPSGRLAGLAYFLAPHLETGLEVLFARIFDSLPPRCGRKEREEWVERFASLFSAPDSDYWVWRYVIGGKKLARPRRLIGRQRAELVIINVMFPFMLGRARAYGDPVLEKKIHEAFCAMPAGEENSVTRFLAARMLGSMPSRAVLSGAARRQGVKQVYADFCALSRHGCLSCGFASYLEKMSLHRGPGG